jgi:hypothetical protein
MWTTAALLAALTLAPEQAGSLKLTNVRTTYGVSGPARPDNKFLPGDLFMLSFDIEGAKADAGGKVRYSIGMDVMDDQGKVVYRQVPRDLETTVAPGSKTLPAFASIQIGLDAPAGNYTVKLTVTDRAAQATQELTRTYQLLPKAFGIVRLTTTNDSDGQTPAPFFQAGKSGWINLTVVGFARDKAKSQPNVTVTLRVLDAKGRPALAKPQTGEVNKDIPEKAPALPLQFVLRLHQPGKYTVELQAADKITGETAKLSFPLTVVKAK